MWIYVGFIIILIITIYYGELTIIKGFESLSIKREFDKMAVFEGEDVYLTTTVENKKWFPISFLMVQEMIPLALTSSIDSSNEIRGQSFVHKSVYRVLWFERVKRTIRLKGTKRGAYLLMDVKISIGDLFGFSLNSKTLNDYIELLVYPKYFSLDLLTYDSNHILGDELIKRWIFKDPLFIRGIREYNVEDRMKDIHWQSSLKMNKLMVKDYDFTSDRKLIVIVNVQCAKPYYLGINEDLAELAIKIGVSICDAAIKTGIPVGMGTNAYVCGINSNFDFIDPSCSSFDSILELSARMSNSAKCDFSDYLLNRFKSFDKNCVYVIVAPFLGDDSANSLIKLRNAGCNIKIVDTSINASIQELPGIEKINYGGN